VPPLDEEFHDEGKRVIIGQPPFRRHQTRCWATPRLMAGIYVRQMKNLKASVPVEWLTGPSFNFYGWACDAILSRAHARIGDPACIEDIALTQRRSMKPWQLGLRATEIRRKRSRCTRGCHPSWRGQSRSLRGQHRVRKIDPGLMFVGASTRLRLVVRAPSGSMQPPMFFWQR